LEKSNIKLEFLEIYTADGLKTDKNENYYKDVFNTIDKLTTKNFL
tara:strand:- start:256 stop:390 length:135 start_codon:yes stop_codon:yes gene_type:complete